MFFILEMGSFNANGHMTAAKSKNTEACKLVEVVQREDDRQKHGRRSGKS